MPEKQTYSNRSSNHFGARLRMRREHFELSLSDMAAATNIREDYISAIERLDEGALPAIGYTLGYVRSYARALGLDPDLAIKDYKSDVALTRLPLRDAPHVILRRQLRLPRGFVSALSVVGVALMLGVWYGTQADAIATTTPQPASALANFNDNTPSEPVLADGFYTLRATAPSWVQVTDADGTQLISRIFVTGETWQGPVKGGYSVSVRDAGAITLYEGSQRIGTLGERGTPVDGLALSRDLPTSDRP